MHFDLQRLRYERMSRKVSQEQVAKALGIQRSTYHKKENGVIKIGVEEFGIILDVLKIPHDDLGIFFTTKVPEREQITS